MPAPLPDDLYWNPMDLDSDESIPYQSKQYIDPWDLENYAYVRQHLDSVDSDPSSVLGEPLDTSGFYYVPGKLINPPLPHIENDLYQRRSDDIYHQQTINNKKTYKKRTPSVERISNYAAVDEVIVRNEVINGRHAGYVDGIGARRSASLYEHPGSSYGWTRRHQLHHFGPDIDIYGTPEWYKDNMTSLQIYEKNNKSSSTMRRGRNDGPVAKMAKSRSHSFSVADYEYDPYSRSSQYQSVISRNPYAMYHPPDDVHYDADVYDSASGSSPVYDDIIRTQRFRGSANKPRHFKLGNYGHLKIDYSFSWNNLNKYIYN